MRKNLTISLDSKDWSLVSDAVRAAGGSYSGFFHRLIRDSLGGQEADPGITTKYRPLFDEASGFLARRAKVWAGAARLGRRSSRKP